MNAFGNPFVLWSRFAWTGVETLINAAQVIGHRSTRMALAGPNPGARDRRENQVMAHEKFRAGSDAAMAMWMRMATLNQQFAMLAVKETLAAATAIMPRGVPRVGAPFAGDQVRLAQQSLSQAAIAASRLSGAGAQIAQQALKPIHARTSKNVKRLRKPAKRRR